MPVRIPFDHLEERKFSKMKKRRRKHVLVWKMRIYHSFWEVLPSRNESFHPGKNQSISHTLPGWFFCNLRRKKWLFLVSVWVLKNTNSQKWMINTLNRKVVRSVTLLVTVAPLRKAHQSLPYIFTHNSVHILMAGHISVFLSLSTSHLPSLNCIFLIFFVLGFLRLFLFCSGTIQLLTDATLIQQRPR